MAKFISDENIRLNIIVNGNPAQKELLDLEKATRDLNRTQKDLRAEKARLIAAGKQETKEYKNVTAEIKKNNATLKENKARLEALQKEIGVTGLTMAQLKKRASVLRLALSHAIPGGEDEKRYRKELTAIGARLDLLKIKGKQTKLSLSSIANGFNKYAALGASVIATTTGIVLGLQKMIDYNGKLADAQSDVQKTTGLTKKEVDELTKSFGVFNTRTSRMNLLKIAEEGGRIGIAKNEIQDFVRVMNKANVALGDSFQGGPEEVASKLGKLKLLFKETKDIGVEDAYEAIGSAINELGANGVATETNIAEFATRIGSLPDALKPTIQDALGLGAAFEESGVQAEISGRAYSIFLGEAAKNSEKFAEVMGITTAEVENMINTNPTEFFLQFSESLAETSEGGVDTAKTLAKLGLSADGVKKIVGAAGNNFGRFREVLALSNTSMIQATSLTNEYNIKNNNLAANLDKLSKKLMGVFSSPVLISGLSTLVGWVTKLIAPTKLVSDQYKEQQLELFTLESRLKDVNIKEEDRFKIIEKLKNQYPTFLGHIDAETTSNLELSNAIKAVNDNLINKIILQEKDEEINEQNETIARRKIKLIDEENNLTKLIAENAQKYNLTIKDGLSLEEQALDISKQLKSTDGAFSIFGGTKDIQQNIDRIKTLKEVINFEEGEGNKLLKEKLDLKKRLSIVDEVEKDTKTTTNTSTTNTTTTTGGGTDPNAKTAEELQIEASKARIAQFIADWNAEQDLQKELKDLSDEEAEILRLEKKYEKMAIDAGFETLQASGLEDVKNKEVQDVKDKWTEIRLKKKKEEDEKFQKLDKESKEALKRAEEDLAQAKRDALIAGIGFLKNFAKEGTALHKALFAVEKAVAIADVIIKGVAERAAISATWGALPLVAGPMLLASKIRTGINVATIAGTAINGFEEGFYPVQRAQDGKMFNAQFGGQTKSGIVNKPTMFLAGENGPELIVDSKAFRQINPDIRSSFQREIARVKGFEVGYYPQPTNTNVAPQTTDVSSGDTSVANIEVINALNRASAIFEKLEKDGIIAYMSNDLKNGKLMQETIENYNTLRNKNKR